MSNNMADKDYGLIIAAIVAIVAIVGLVILFSKGGATGLQIGATNQDNIGYFDPDEGGLVTPYQTEKVYQIWNRKDAGQIPFVPYVPGGEVFGTFGPSKEFTQSGGICYWTTQGCPHGATACQVCP